MIILLVSLSRVGLLAEQAPLLSVFILQSWSNQHFLECRLAFQLLEVLQSVELVFNVSF